MLCQRKATDFEPEYQTVVYESSLYDHNTPGFKQVFDEMSITDFVELTPAMVEFLTTQL